MDINGLSRGTSTDRERTTRRVLGLTGSLGAAAVLSAVALTLTLGTSDTSVTTDQAPVATSGSS